jgi:uncharacterized cupredoxin-like copper-binding protein
MSKAAVTIAAGAMLLLSTAFTGPLSAHDATAFSAGEPGHVKKPSRTVRVTMRESDGRMLYEPARIEVRHGEQIRFIITNAGELPHEFTLASTTDNLKHAEVMQKYPDMEHDDPNAKTIQPKGVAEMLWHFSKRGEFEFACLIPGHREAGMLGKVVVK